MIPKDPNIEKVFINRYSIGDEEITWIKKKLDEYGEAFSLPIDQAKQLVNYENGKNKLNLNTFLPNVNRLFQRHKLNIKAGIITDRKTGDKRIKIYKVPAEVPAEKAEVTDKKEKKKK